MACCVTALAHTVPATPPEAQPCQPGQRLAPGEACAVAVDSRPVEVALPLALVPGDRLALRIQRGQLWADWHRPFVSPEAGDAVDIGPAMRALARFKRMPDAPYMALGMAVSTCGGSFPGSQGCTVGLSRLTTQPSELDVTSGLSVGFFANDVPLFTLNNQGAVWLIVERR